MIVDIGSLINVAIDGPLFNASRQAVFSLCCADLLARPACINTSRSADGPGSPFWRHVLLIVS